MKPCSILRLGAATLVLVGSTQLALATPASLPPVQHAGDMSYLSGGVESDQSAAIKGTMRSYPLGI